MAIDTKSTGNGSSSKSMPDGPTRKDKETNKEDIKNLRKLMSLMEKVGGNLKQYSDEVNKCYRENLARGTKTIEKNARKNQADTKVLKKSWDAMMKLMKDNDYKDSITSLTDSLKSTALTEKHDNSAIKYQKAFESNMKTLLDNKLKAEEDLKNGGASKGEIRALKDMYKQLRDQLVSDYENGIANELLKGQREILQEKWDKIDEDKKFEDSKKVKSKFVKDENENVHKTLEEFNSAKTDLFRDYAKAFGSDNKDDWTDEQRKQYQDDLDALNAHYLEEMKEAKQKDREDKKHWYDSIKETVSKVYSKNETALKTAMLGSVMVFAKPLEDFFGGSVFQGVKAVFGKGKELFKKFTKKKPTASDVLKMGAEGMGFLYLANKLSVEDDEKEDSSPLDKIKKVFTTMATQFKALGTCVASLIAKFGKLGKMFGNFAKGGFKLGAKGTKIAQGLGIGAIVMAVIDMVIDGIKFMMNDAFGGSKVSKFIAGFLGGQGEKGAKGAFKNAGKWALLGAGIGTLIAPVIGTLIGGAIGAIIGAILGAVGAENLTKGFDAMGRWFRDVVWEQGLKPMFNFFKDYILELFNVKQFMEIWQGEGSIVKKIGKTIGLALYTIITLPIRRITVFIEKFKATAIGKKIFNKETWKSIGLGIKNFFVKIFTAIFKFIPKLFTSDFWKSVIENIKNFFGKVIEKVTSVISTIGDVISTVVDKVKWFFSELFGGIVEGFSSGLLAFKNWWDNSWIGDVCRNVFSSISDGISTFFSRENPILKFLKRWVITPIGNFFAKIGDYIDAISSVDLMDVIKHGTGIFSEIGRRADSYSDARVERQHNEILNEEKQSRVADLQARYARKHEGDGTDYTTDADYIAEYAKIQALRFEDVNDAIIKADGTIIRTSVDDNIIATKNLPQNVDSIQAQSRKDLNNQLKTISSDSKVNESLTKIIELLGALLDKEISIPQQNQTRADMDLIINGGLI